MTRISKNKKLIDNEKQKQKLMDSFFACMQRFVRIEA